MYKLRVTGALGLLGTILGLGNFFFGVRDEQSTGLVLFIAGVTFLAAAWVGIAVLDELRKRTSI